MRKTKRKINVESKAFKLTHVLLVFTMLILFGFLVGWLLGASNPDNYLWFLIVLWITAIITLILTITNWLIDKREKELKKQKEGE